MAQVLMTPLTSICQCPTISMSAPGWVIASCPVPGNFISCTWENPSRAESWRTGEQQQKWAEEGNACLQKLQDPGVGCPKKHFSPTPVPPGWPACHCCQQMQLGWWQTQTEAPGKAICHFKPQLVVPSLSSIPDNCIQLVE